MKNPLRFLGSMFFAVVLIVLLSVIMAWATFIDRDYGSDASLFAIYSSWWFILLFSLLGVSVIASALLRFPWKRHQIGFLVTHLGIVVLLAGCWMTLARGKSATLCIWEGTSSQTAVSGRSEIVLQVFGSDPAEKFRKDTANYEADPFRFAEKTELKPKTTLLVSFHPGPFTWDFYKKAPFFSFQKGEELPRFPWAFADSDRHHPVLLDRDGIRLEVLDYRAAAEKKPVATGPEIILVKDSQAAEPEREIVELKPRQRHFTSTGAALSYTEAATDAEVEAFQACVPDMSLLSENENVLLTLFADGKPFSFLLESMAVEKPQALDGTAWTVTLARRDPNFYYAELAFQHTDGRRATLRVMPHSEEMTQQSPENGLFAWSWVKTFPPVSEELPAPPEIRQMMQRLGMMQKCPQIEILRAPDGRLFGRTWRAPVCEAFTISEDGPTRIFENTELASTVTLCPKGTPDLGNYVISPTPLTKISEKNTHDKIRAVKIRLTVDGNSEERWVCGTENDRRIPAPPPQPDEVLTVKGENRWVSAALRYEEITLGFRLRLERFNRRLDPGTSTPARYSSDVTLLDPQNPENILRENIPIIINQPVDFHDARVNRCWRVYQSSFKGPYPPSTPQFSRLVPADSQRQHIYLSEFRVSDDPGRGFLYLGCFLIVTGIGIMFYMKAYFFGSGNTAAQ